MNKILFVDDDEAFLRGITRKLRRAHPDWELVTQTGGKEALNYLEQSQEDLPRVVISDMKMPGMTGLQFLTALSESYPQIPRILLSGEAGEENRIRMIEVADQCLGKPTTTEEIVKAIEKALKAIEQWPQMWEKRISRRFSIPVLRETVEAFQKAMDEGLPVERLAEIAQKDCGLMWRLVQLANSPFFCPQGKESLSIKGLIEQLGTSLLDAILKDGQIFRHQQDACFAEKLSNLNLQPLWEKSQKNALKVEELVQKGGGDSRQKEAAYLAGMFQYLDEVLDPLYNLREGEQQEKPVVSYFLSMSSCPQLIADAVAFHCDPIQYEGPENLALAALHVARAQEEGVSPCPKSLEQLGVEK